jgi:ribosomal protein L28
MSKHCEITGKRESHPSNLPEGTAAPKRPMVLSRKVNVTELGKGGSVRINISEAGLKIVQEAGGLVKYVQETADKKLSATLLKLKAKFPPPEPEKPKEEAPAAETAPVEEAPAAEDTTQDNKEGESSAEEKPSVEEVKE